MTERRTGLVAGLVIVLAALAAYHATFSAPFVFDDTDSIVGNPTIRRLWPIGPVLSPPAATGQTVGGRPLLNLSLALNYAIGGLRVEGYHLTNLGIHLLAGLTLFGIVRRTLRRRPSATLLAFAVALLWTVHPLQTESVTYLIQRAESLMGLCYLLTLYGFIRYAEGTHAGWAVLSFLACLGGMATKEVMVSAPVMVLLYDGVFVTGGLRAAWRRHGRLHLALAGTWLLLAALVLPNHTRGGSTGFGSGISWAHYVRLQFPAIVHYLRLAVWPHPLIFDYGTQWVGWPGLDLPAAVAVLALVALTVAALRRCPAVGFLGAWFFAILAPTSLVPGNRQTLAEHRMYLALIPVVVALVLGLDRLWERAGRSSRWTLVTCLGLAAAGTALTARRNEDYRSNLVLWADTVAKVPGNPYAQADLGVALDGAGDEAGAAAHYAEALRLKPDMPNLHKAHDDLGIALAKLGRLPEAQAQFEEAVRLMPSFPAAHNDLGNALRREGRLGEAEAELREAVRLQPDYTTAWLNLALVCSNGGRWPEAIAAGRRAAELEPADAETHLQLANVLAQAGQLADAVPEYERSLQLNPRSAAAHDHLGHAWAALGRPEAAARELAAAARLGPGP
jgi:tetratricopeptide (TPR) repeat protein